MISGYYERPRGITHPGIILKMVCIRSPKLSKLWQCWTIIRLYDSVSYSTKQCKQHVISQPSCLMISFKCGNINITARWLGSNVILNLPHITSDCLWKWRRVLYPISQLSSCSKAPSKPISPWIALHCTSKSWSLTLRYRHACSHNHSYINFVKQLHCKKCAIKYNTSSYINSE